MGTFEIDIEISRHAREVFAALADVRVMPQWYEAVKHVVALTPDRSGLGSRYEIGRTLPGGPVKNEIAITEFEPDRWPTARGFDSKAGLPVKGCLVRSRTSTHLPRSCSSAEWARTSAR
jgi:hypothetical protein